MNKIKLAYLDCKCPDVLFISIVNEKKMVNYRCLGAGQKHNFTKNLTEDTGYQKFFKAEVYS